jgi:hypothetical protein
MRVIEYYVESLGMTDVVRLHTNQLKKWCVKNLKPTLRDVKRYSKILFASLLIMIPYGFIHGWVQPGFSLYGLFFHHTGFYRFSFILDSILQLLRYQYHYC